ncbi:hypothetical protein HYPBUDRAFT_163527 [Hyphopichia burtonii NRRL Y-1933]|uniref:Pyridoxamine 5'-phosphate oxidase N-terminal domain-containing protein n=1 Tax=Hyphopichia burtonii NRRL Y-1933 TaxID=984485 RepID=A0A1E4RDD9_9ASCO|nr:hypothetical protein HYPBUDRAFT_163527 [Hyphopichia burtonii NRRL Y-1933]ODV65289.1 hypothetical protein HYPBUDRAFT_163527 [Hyphopichia burtonii NRRL Y-1933]
MSTALSLPDSVVKLLKSTRFVHLATCKDNFPHVSLMNYTYYSKENEYYIITTSPKKTTKYENIISNPNVSLLVHDWISARNPDESTSDSVANKRRNSLYELLTNLNKSEISSVSVMINGKAEILSPHTDLEKFNFFKSLHLNNDSIDAIQSKNYIESEDIALILIKVSSVKVTDTNDNVESY